MGVMETLVPPARQNHLTLCQPLPHPGPADEEEVRPEL